MRVGVAGYGNLGRALLRVAPDFGIEVGFVLSRRAGSSALGDVGAPIYHLDEASLHRGEVDALVIAGGSADDLEWMTPTLARDYNVVDSFDTHCKIESHLGRCDEAAMGSGHIAIVSVGWDPGILSLTRLYARAIMPDGIISTVWGKGVSQGHSSAVRRIAGVKDAVQYTIPDEAALAKLRCGELCSPTSEKLHIRECFVVAENECDREQIEAEIKAMPEYFLGYRTLVHFITEDEMQEHKSLAHAGRVVAVGEAGGRRSTAELSLSLEGNPEFTASIMLAYAKAAVRMNGNGITGAFSVFDIPPSELLTGWVGEGLL